MRRGAEPTVGLVRVVRLDHVQLAMPEGREAVAIAFYEGVLGIPQVPKPAELAARGGCWFEDGEVRVHLGVDLSFVPARKAHVALAVVGLDVLRARLRTAAHDVRDEPMPGHDRCYTDDPFGNRLELLEPLS
jgi:catechol 2,3-dioxygenase-like lactoylglutathione lyase family enzyme